jgi:hypothetical protein
VSTLSIFCLRVRVKLFEAIYLSAGRFSYNKEYEEDQTKVEENFNKFLQRHLENEYERIILHIRLSKTNM